LLATEAADVTGASEVADSDGAEDDEEPLCGADSLLDADEHPAASTPRASRPAIVAV
jgi:hypothetical protein